MITCRCTCVCVNRIEEFIESIDSIDDLKNLHSLMHLHCSKHQQTSAKIILSTPSCRSLRLATRSKGASIAKQKPTARTGKPTCTAMTERSSPPSPLSFTIEHHGTSFRITNLDYLVCPAYAYLILSVPADFASFRGFGIHKGSAKEGLATKRKVIRCYNLPREDLFNSCHSRGQLGVITILETLKALSLAVGSSNRIMVGASI